MTPLPGTANRPADRPKTTDARLTELVDRLETTERDVERLRNAVDGIARERGVSLTVPGRCGRSLLLHREGVLSCPCCGYRRSV